MQSGRTEQVLALDCFPTASQGERAVKLKLDGKAISRELTTGLIEEFLWDTELEGFGLRIRRRRNGELQRTYVAQYRADRRTRRVKLGAAGKVSLAQAREAARRTLARATLGHDPQGERAAQRLRAARTLRTVAETYLDSRHDVLRPSSLRVAQLYLFGPYFRSLHAVGIADITQADIAACLATIARQHSAKTAAAARRTLSALFRFAVEEGFRPDNPVVNTRRPVRPAPRDRVLSDAELVAILRACDDGGEFGTVIKLLVLLGARRQEVGSMRWSELNLDAGTWTLPAERSKNHRPHTIPLPPTALEILRRIPSKREYLFGERGPGFTAWGRVKAEFDRRLADFVQPWRLHDLRRSVATKLADIGIEPHLIEIVLGHAAHRSGISGVYNHSHYQQQVRVALARWDRHISDLLEGRAEK
jgi:integrase